MRILEGPRQTAGQPDAASTPFEPPAFMNDQPAAGPDARATACSPPASPASASRAPALPHLAFALCAATAACLLPTPGAQGQEGAVTGRVVAEDGTPVDAATVRLFPVSDTTAVRFAGTDRLGFFSFPGVQPGQYVLAVARIGFAGRRERLSVGAEGRTGLETVLEREAVQLEGVRVEAERSRTRVRFEEQAGVTVQEVDKASLKAIPGLAESDPVRVVELLPGVTTVSDFSAAFNVRGGSADQNLILLDDVPIFNPFHLGGFFSVFNADMVDRAELRSGGFPAEYGGRVSSVLTVESDAGDGGFGVDAGVSVLATRVAVNGALPEGAARGIGFSSTRWRVSARRSYFDILFRPWVDFPYSLSDLQTVFEGWTRGGGRLRITAYTGRDLLDLGQLDEEDAPLKVRWAWGNAAAGASWTHPMSGGGALDVRASYSRFDADLDFSDFEDTDFATDVWQATFRTDLERRPTPRTRWKSGLAASRVAYDNAVQVGGAVFTEGTGDGWEASGYTQLHWEPSSRWLLEGGLRVDHWRPGLGSDETTVSPRFAVKRFVRNRRSAVRLAGGRYSQFLQSRRDEQLPVGLDVWVVAGERAPRVVSEQVQLGVESFFGSGDEWFASAEGYYRVFRGLIADNPADDPNDALDDLLSGTGYAYGADLFVKRDLGVATGWLSASYLKTERTFPDTRSNLDPVPSITYPPVFDRRFDLDLVLRRPLGWGVEGSVRFNFGTGLPFTRPLGTFAFYRRRPIYEAIEYDYETAVLLGPRNDHRYPSRHRLDIGFRKTFPKSWGHVTPYVNVVNVYNQKNVLFYAFEYDRDPPVRTGVSMIPVLPTVGVEMSFR